MNSAYIAAYERLESLPNRDEDLLTSEDYQELLNEHGKTSYADNLRTTAQIKLGREQFQTAYGFYHSLREQGTKLQDAQKLLVQYLFDQMLQPLSAAEKRVLILDSISRIGDWLSHPLTETERLQLTEKSDEELLTLLTEGVQEIAGHSIAEALNNGELDRETVYESLPNAVKKKENSSYDHFNAEAWAGAGYATEPEWQEKAGLLGIIGEMISNVVDESMSNVFSGDGSIWKQSLSDIIGDILVTASTLCAATCIICAEYYVLGIPFISLLSLGELTMKELLFSSILKDFLIGTVCAVGTGIIGVLCKAGNDLLAMFKNTQEEKTSPAENISALDNADEAAMFAPSSDEVESCNTEESVNDDDEETTFEEDDAY